jgi:rhamnose utilization protein RhaD (predicted bifunctional aldolase and dehydrogenase)/NAD(P)-dependent dehydrogenase (short-subunit alcohol dehydrogenase family)
MENMWDEVEASTYKGELRSLVYACQLLYQDESLGFYGGGNASLKKTTNNLLGEEEEKLFINYDQPSDLNPPDDADPELFSMEDFITLRSKPLTSLVKLETLDISLLKNELACSRTVAISPAPPVNSLLHAVLPYKYVLVSQPDAILAIANTPNGQNRLHAIYGDSVSILSYTPTGFPLAKACVETLEKKPKQQLTGIFIFHQGLVTFGETAQLAYNRQIDLVTRAVQYLKQQKAWEVVGLSPVSDKDQPTPYKVARLELAALRQAVSTIAGRPLILTSRTDPDSLNFCRRTDLTRLTQEGPAVAEHAVLIKRWPLIGRDIDAYRLECERATDESGGRFLPHWYDLAPRIILDPELGLCALGRTAKEAALTARIYHHTMDISLRASALESYHSLSPEELLRAELSAYPDFHETSVSTEHMFNGEIALVTGGASGIGKACVESLLARGAAVVNLDINPVVTTMLDRPDYLGLQCDLTNEDVVLAAFERLARVFGGLDMLVLNAGIFPAGCRIESLTLEEWQRVMRINLDSNLIVLREAHALLKHSPRGGRVLVNASKNVHAPGAGAAAYSASKAAVTQLARVAALEWGKDHIRVNQIHPDAIFDTGIWTEEVLKARAAHYGMTVQQYKTRNILGVELNSHYVGELVAEMLGPHFEKITGAQIPVDGGSDRVI